MPADVSVIIAAYNVEAYIERAIRSALDQEAAAVEVIVINDASTDHTMDVVARIGDLRIKRIDLAVNGGPSTARNAGLEAATAPWIAILDGDDAFAPKRLMHCLTRAKAVKADIVVDNLSVYREADGTEHLMFPTAEFSRIGMLDLAGFIAGNTSFLGGSALGYLKPMFSTEFLRRYNLRYDPTLRIGEDYMLMCEALAKDARCVVEPTAGYLYTARKGSISHRLALDDIVRIADSDAKFLARNTLNPAAARAQKKRERKLSEAFVFTQLVDTLKRRDVMGALRLATKQPAAALNLWRPVCARIARVF